MQDHAKNTHSFGPSLRIGVLGGGQLGRMLIQSAVNFDVRIEVMDGNIDAPCSHLTPRFVHGDLNDSEAVVSFGKELDVVTIEIEHVSVAGLRQLEANGIRVVPKPDHLEIIQDKGTQKAFFEAHGIPTAKYTCINGKEDIGAMGFPIVQKLRRGGYDGKGVQLLKSHEEASQWGFDAPCLLETAVDIHKELSVIIARNGQGQTASYPVVEAVFDPTANLVDYLIAPAEISDKTAAAAQQMALHVVESMHFEGLLAVELFLDQKGELLVNEIAPRTHNSGHHTIEANQTSQFEQHLRAVLDLPLGPTTATVPASAMLNLVGDAHAQGSPVYTGLADAMAIPGVHPHLYGKSQVKPFRKMGHVTVTGASTSEVRNRIVQLREQLAVNGMSDVPD